MATSSDGPSPGPTSAPNLQLWDMLYCDGKDEWTRTEADEELLKFHDVVTVGKTGMDILVPMCGKTKLMLSLVVKGHRVVGIEWSKTAVEQLFEENGLPYSVQSSNIGGTDMPMYKANCKALTIYCGDIFAFKQDNLGGFDCVFDHGTFISVVYGKRTAYAEVMSSFVKPGGRMLLSIFDYEHSEHPKIPLAITESEVVTLYMEHFKPPELLGELDAVKTDDIFKFHERDTLFPVWTLSHFSWKFLLLVKHSSSH